MEVRARVDQLAEDRIGLPQEFPGRRVWLGVGGHSSSNLR
jgi:hypothetical protein